MNRDELPEWMDSFFAEVFAVTEIYRCPDCESYDRFDYSVDEDFSEEKRTSCHFHPGKTVTSVSSEVYYADDEPAEGYRDYPKCPVCNIDMDLFFYDEVYEGEDLDGHQGENQGN